MYLHALPGWKGPCPVGLKFAARNAQTLRTTQLQAENFTLLAHGQLHVGFGCHALPEQVALGGGAHAHAPSRTGRNQFSVLRTFSVAKVVFPLKSQKNGFGNGLKGV